MRSCKAVSSLAGIATCATYQAIRDLPDMPGKGHARADVKDPRYRFWCVYSYLIAYRFDDKSLTVVRVVHGRRNLRRLFRRRQ